MGTIFYVDGEYVPEEQAVLPIGDLAILRGYGVFDFMRTYGGRPFHLRDHIERLERSAQIVGLTLPAPVEQIEQIVLKTLRKNSAGEYDIRIVVTGGPSEDSITPAGKPRLIVMVSELSPIPAEWYEKGVKIATVSMERRMPWAKSLNYVAAVMALREAARKSAAEAVYTDKDGNLREGTTSNIFAFVHGKLVTPCAESVLPGITRQVVLSLAENEFEIEIRKIHRRELETAEGVFLSSSVKEVLPVVMADDATVGDGKPCERTRLIMEKFSEYTRKFAEGKILG